jgi:curved DNA-binding protein CbpA
MNRVKKEKETYYDILGITQNSTFEEIRKAYKKKAILLHPVR